MYSFSHRTWEDLPRNFLLSTLMVVMLCEMLSSYMHMGTVSELLYLRIVEAVLLWVLVIAFKVYNNLGFTRLTHQNIHLILCVTSIGCIAVLLLAFVLKYDYAWIHLPQLVYSAKGLFLMFCVAPVVEELFFRGVIYRLLRQAFGVWIAVLLSAICFSSMHGNWLSLPLLGGVVFAMAYEYSRNLWVAMFLHMVGNMLIVGLAWLDGMI